MESARSPRVLEFGEPAITVSEERLRLEVRGRWLSFEAWEEGRFLSRRVVRIKSQSRDRLELVVQRFGGHEAVLTLFDAARPSNEGLRQKGKRQAFGAVFRRMLQREFPGWRIHELSTEANLQESLSPAHPRAILRRGTAAIAAIAAPPGSDVDAALSFGLIWLDYLRRREQNTARCGGLRVNVAAHPKSTWPDSTGPPGRSQEVSRHGWTLHRAAIQGLAVFLPQGRVHTTRLRLRWLDPAAAQWMLFEFDDSGHSAPVDLRDCGNLDTHMEQASRRAASAGRLNPEALIEDQVRSQIRQIEADLRPEPVYGQVPAFAGCDRGIMDLLGISYGGRLTVLELKASESVHLPLQALDYWIRVQWHLERGDFPRHGYFPGLALSKQAPRLMLVAPAMRFHSTNERVLRFFDPRIEVEMVGVAPGWAGPVRVLCRDQRLHGAPTGPGMASGTE